MNIQQAISSMSPEVRSGAEAAARRMGLSLDAFMEMKLSQNLTDDELEAVAGGRRNRTEYYHNEVALDQE